MPEAPRRGKDAKPDCYTGYWQMPITVRASTCASCFAKKTCMPLSEAKRDGTNVPQQGNTTLNPGYQPQSIPQQPVQIQPDPRVAQWDQFWQELQSALQNNPSTIELSNWMENLKRQRIG